MVKNKGFTLLEIIVIMLVTSIIASITTGVIMLNNSTTYIGNLSEDKELTEFINVYETLLSKYYTDIDREGMLNAAEEGMLNFLGDKYTTYLDNNEYKEILDDLSGTYKGIGISIINNEIVDVTEYSPAEKAGIMKGDLIVKLNNNNVENYSSAEIKKIISDNNSDDVTLEINRNGQIIEFYVKKDELINKSVNYKIIENTTIGYLQITKFSENLGDQVEEALNYLESNQITSLIIDVRDNVGGYLKSVEDVSAKFLEEGKILYSLETSTNKYDFKDETKEKRNYPIAVLINHNSASASEILASALKYSYNATLIGNVSYGKGKVQQVAELNNGDSVKYTSAKWLTPSGICIDGIGLTPDYEISLDESGVDYQLQKALEVLGLN